MDTMQNRQIFCCSPHQLTVALRSDWICRHTTPALSVISNGCYSYCCVFRFYIADGSIRILLYYTQIFCICQCCFWDFHGNPFSDFFGKTFLNRPADSLRSLPATSPYATLLNSLSMLFSLQSYCPAQLPSLTPTAQCLLSAPLWYNNITPL